MVTRRIIRTLVQIAVASTATFLVIFFLDRNFWVIPKAIHDYMPLHNTGLVITDVQITKCSSLHPFTSCELDPTVWFKINKDLYLGKARLSSAYLHVRRKKEEELTPEDKVVVDVTVGRLNPGAGAKAQDGDMWESREAGIWIKRSTKKGASENKKAVTAIDLLFGDDAVEAREGWEVTGIPLMLDAGPKIPSAHLTVRRGLPHEKHTKPVPRINENGKFKIVQLADLHLSTGVGECRDALPPDYNGGPCEADPRTLDFVTRILEDEKPDLVVLSGDQINGATAPDPQGAIFKYASLLIKHKVPYVSIFGNHDDEASLGRSGQMALIETLPYSLSQAGPADIDGVGNYYVEVLARGGSTHSALTIYLLDTHSYSPNERKYKGYDWLKKTQIEWFRNTAESLKKKHKEYTHIHMDVSFIHIPLPEYVKPVPQWWVGNWTEPVTAPVFNSGFRDALVEQGVVMVGCGHDHVNEYCALSMEPIVQEGDEHKKEKSKATKEGGEEEKVPQRPALWMCYGGATGFAGYAGYGGFYRKIRVYEFDMNQASITTWKRVEWGDTEARIDEHTMVIAGKPVAPPEPEPELEVPAEGAEPAAPSVPGAAFIPAAGSDS